MTRLNNDVLMYIIRDTATGEVYARRCGKGGWYTTNLYLARLYLTAEAAQRTIDKGNHHVSYPGNRALAVEPLTSLN